MTRWLSLRQLAGTALRVVLSQVFGAYSDKREIQGALPADERLSYAGRRELWFGIGHAVAHSALIVAVMGVSAAIASAVFGEGTMFVVAFVALVGGGGACSAAG